MSRVLGERVTAVAIARHLMMIVLLIFLSSTLSHTVAQGRTMERTYIRGGLIDTSKPKVVADSLSVIADSLLMGDSLMLAKTLLPDSLSKSGTSGESILTENNIVIPVDSTKLIEKQRARYFSDTMSLSKVCWTAALLPGFGQIYNKQPLKLPFMYAAMAGGLALYLNESKTYRPLKAEYDEITYSNLYRTEELNKVQNEMIKSNTKRQLYLGVTLGTYIYMLGDAAVNYTSDNEVSDIKRATTLATICPGAGQIYNKSYWKLPFVVGGFAAMIYVVDWNNRGYKRFSKAYQQVLAYNEDPDAYDGVSPDEFAGRYSSSDLQSLRDMYRRNRDLSIIMSAGLYLLQIIDAHVDAHFKAFDISDELAIDIEPALGYVYSPSTNSNGATYGFNVGIRF